MEQRNVHPDERPFLDRGRGSGASIPQRKRLRGPGPEADTLRPPERRVVDETCGVPRRRGVPGIPAQIVMTAPDLVERPADGGRGRAERIDISLERCLVQKRVVARMDPDLVASPAGPSMRPTAPGSVIR